MKMFLLGTVGLVALGLAAPAVAADLPQRTYKAAPVMIAAVYDWSGFYIGANGGWGSSRNCWGFVNAAGTVTADGCADRSGGLIGGQVGYRWQAGQFVFGLEAQGDWANLSGSSASVLFAPNTLGTKTNGLGLFTGQIGYAMNAALLYVKGGAAVTSNSAYINNAAGVGLYSASSTRWGGSLGVGFEYGFAPNWSAGIEYDHLWMGNANNSFSVPVGVIAAAANRISQDVDMVTVRVNYRFGGPVVAKY